MLHPFDTSTPLSATQAQDIASRLDLNKNILQLCPNNLMVVVLACGQFPFSIYLHEKLRIDVSRSLLYFTRSDWYPAG